MKPSDPKHQAFDAFPDRNLKPARSRAHRAALGSFVALALSPQGGLDLLHVPCGCDCRPKVELGAVRRKPLQRQAPTEAAGRLDSEEDVPGPLDAP